MSIENGRVTDRGWEFSDNVTYKVLDYDQQSFAKVSDDYPGAFKPQQGGQPHPTGLGTLPGTGMAQEQAPTAGGKGLIIRLAATHSGLITRNNGFYLPDKMRDGAKTFVDLYPKPIQVHHEDHKDPVGRVVDSRYVETVGQVVDRYQDFVLRDSRKKDVGRANTDFWKDFCSDKTSFIQKLQMIKLMDNILLDKHYRGVGFIELTADITDKDAVQKVLDGRFLTGSVGAVSDKAVCSICNTNWLEDEHCGHRPGKVYEDKKCFVVAGSLEYDEYSFVNTPADRHSTITSIESGSVLDSVKDNREKKLFFYPIADYFHEEDSAMENDTTANDPEVEVKDETQTSEINDTEGVVTTPDVEAGADADVQDAANVSAESGTEVIVEDDASDTSIEDKVQEVHPAELVMEKLFVEDQEFSASDEDALYDFMLSELTEDEFKDAKLSADARKKLPASAFCGPNRSFPVNDCAHYTAAKRLLNRYKGPGDKSEISKSIDRKGKALGCSSSKKDGVACDPCIDDQVNGEVETKDPRLTADLTDSLLQTLDQTLYGCLWKEEDSVEVPVFTDDETQVLRTLTSDLAKRIGKDNFVQALVDEGLIRAQDELEIQVEETHKLEDQIGDLRDQLTALRQELRASYSDIETISDQLVDAHSKLRVQKIARLDNLYTLNGTITDEVKEGFASLSDEVLDNSLEMLSGEVDMTKIADKVNDGLSRTPEEIVDNPTEVTPPSVTEEIKDTAGTQPTFQTQNQVDNEYRRIYIQEKNPHKAKAYYADAVNRGLAKSKPGFDT